MSLAAGSRLGPYEIVTPIGAGGMGEVYRARDPRLGRDVAVKVLPASFSKDPDRLRRFEQEARAAGVLNHPNIMAVYDIGTVEGSPYVVSELLEGETLRSRLGGGPLAPRRATEYAVQIAHGLSAAHEKGIVHRDLKPENLFVTEDGHLKILDFGLAKRTEQDRTDETSAPTESKLTEPGVVMGTVGYMSPEQVRGLPVDYRSDIFSFGAILYELLSGKKAFKRDTAADTMSAILKEEPPASTASGFGPLAALQRIVQHCLEKKPGERFQSARDLVFALESALGESGPGESTHGASVRWERPSLITSALGFIILLLSLALLWTLRRSPEQTSAVAIRLVTHSGHDASPAVSPDGSILAFTSDRDGQSRIWLKQLKGGGEVAITIGSDDFPRFSPDGTSVLYIHSEGGKTSLHRISLLGNDPHKVVEDAEQGDWSPDGKQIAFVRLLREQNEILSALFLIDAAGGAERELTRFKGELVGFPRWSPDGRHIILNNPIIITSGALHKLFLVDVKDGSFQEIQPASPGILSTAAWVSSEEIVFLQSKSLSGAGTAWSASQA